MVASATKDILPAGKQHKLGDKVRRERADHQCETDPDHEAHCRGSTLLQHETV